MPIYEYECRRCGKGFEHLARLTAARDDAVPCPACGARETTRKFSVFAVGVAEARPAQGAMPGWCACGREPGSCAINA